MVKLIRETNDLFTVNPVIAAQWHPIKNSPITPHDVLSRAGKRVWWKCQKGHEWESMIKHRTIRGDGCPFCSGRRVIKGENDFETVYPLVATEWNYNRNEKKPFEYHAKSNCKIWWKCKKGHEWVARINDRARGRKCPYCAGKKVIKGVNDLETLYPEVLFEWDYNRNEKAPSKYSRRSSHKVWWICNQNHKWEAEIKLRVRGSGCPYCANKIPVKGKNDLYTLYPDLAEEWNKEKNSGLLISEFKAQSNKKVWWKCQEGHEWKAYVYSRVNGRGCPYCAGRLPIIGKTDLETVDPELAIEWNYEKNRKLKPEDVTKKSNKKVWWKCKKGHEWMAAVYHRRQGTACPICYKLRENL